MPSFEDFVVQKSAAPKTIAIIGHKGRMGGMFWHLWKKAGHKLQGADLATGTAKDPHTNVNKAELERKDLQKAILGAKIVVVCVPALALESVLKSLSPLLSPEQILVDITSVKTTPLQQMCALFSGSVVGTHPLFGPVAEKEDLVVAITPSPTCPEADITLVEDLFTVFACKCFRTTPKAHDLGVAFAQALNFATNAMYFATVAGKPEILPFITPSFRRRLGAGEKQLTDDANMFLGFIAANPEMPTALAHFKETLAEMEQGQLAEIVRKAQSWYI